jgi:hypothetical protein
MRLVGTNFVAAAHIMADNPGVNCPDAKSGAGAFMRSRLGGDSKLSYSIIFRYLRTRETIGLVEATRVALPIVNQRTRFEVCGPGFAFIDNDGRL